ncbi:MAG: hypothetical protein HQ557_19320 [Bacteroidetes bacterium]|nr:hypothetical protein [Bacteroidota bacterium]
MANTFNTQELKCADFSQLVPDLQLLLRYQLNEILPGFQKHEKTKVFSINLAWYLRLYLQSSQGIFHTSFMFSF